MSYTEKEQIVLDWIKQCKEDGHELIYACDIEYGTTLSNNQARGSVSSLIKKGVISVDEGLISVR